MIQKLFPLDKNYILRQAQSVLEEELLDQMVAELKASYTQLYNPISKNSKKTGPQPWYPMCGNWASTSPT